ncbi:MAG: cell division protein FtsA [Candidatus Liptonbacteria bacterium]|nr:cell division protein FtsA [Candidatus Liptonbacteria bacterium]
MAQNLITGLDIGTGDIKAVVAEVGRGKTFCIRHVARKQSAGMRKGAIVDIEETVSSLRNIFADIRTRHPKALRNIYVNINSPQVRLHNSKGIVAVSRADAEIYHDDVDRAVKASQAITLPSNRIIFHAITREFVVDGIDGILDPIGLSGSRLEVNSMLVDAFSFDLRTIEKCVSMAGGTLGGVVFGPLAASRAVLSKTQKDLGVVLVDIGCGTTGISVYEENKLLHAAVFPVGSAHITNDIAIGLKIPVGAAETLKLSYGTALAKSVPIKETVDMSAVNADTRTAVSRRFLSEIIEVRLSEVLEAVNTELQKLNRHGRLPGGAVFIGGGAKMTGLLELAKRDLRLPVQFGSVDPNAFTVSDQWLDPNDTLTDPEFVMCFGLILSGVDAMAQEHFSVPEKFSIKRILRFFLP